MSNLGDSPLKHAKALRKLIVQYGRVAQEVSRRAAEGTAGACLFAQEMFEEAHRLRGQVQAHMDSLGSKRQFAMKKIDLAKHAREMIKARKALEQHCGRKRAI
jgi:hypothetical protein